MKHSLLATILASSQVLLIQRPHFNNYCPKPTDHALLDEVGLPGRGQL